MFSSGNVVKNREIQPKAAFDLTKNPGSEWANSNPRMQIALVSYEWGGNNITEGTLTFSVDGTEMSITGAFLCDKKVSWDEYGQPIMTLLWGLDPYASNSMYRGYRYMLTTEEIDRIEYLINEKFVDIK